jgi:hypothetical protein
LRFPPVRLLLVLALLHLALKHARYMELLGLLPPLFLAAPLAAQWRQSQQDKPQFSGADRIFAMLTPRAGVAAVVLAAVLAAVLPLAYHRASTLAFPETIAPKAAVNAVVKARIGGPVLNQYEWGGYLIYRGIAPFIDGRADMYGGAFFEKYVAAVEAKTPEALHKVLETHQVAWTLLTPDSPAVTLLDRTPGWRRFHADDTAVVHVRSSAPAPAPAGPGER